MRHHSEGIKMEGETFFVTCCQMLLANLAVCFLYTLTLGTGWLIGPLFFSFPRSGFASLQLNTVSYFHPLSAGSWQVESLYLLVTPCDTFITRTCTVLEHWLYHRLNPNTIYSSCQKTFPSINALACFSPLFLSHHSISDIVPSLHAQPVLFNLG